MGRAQQALHHQRCCHRTPATGDHQPRPVPPSLSERGPEGYQAYVNQDSTRTRCCSCRVVQDRSSGIVHSTDGPLSIHVEHRSTSSRVPGMPPLCTFRNVRETVRPVTTTMASRPYQLLGKSLPKSC